MHGQRIGQPFAARDGQLGRELPRQFNLIALVQLPGQGKFHFPEKPPVDPLMLVRRFPIGARVILGPLRHVLRFPVGEFVILALVLPFALDVIGLGAGRLSAQARSRFYRQVEDRHFRIRVA